MKKYLIDNEKGVKIFHAFSYTNFTWERHTQNSYELVMVKKGILTAQVDGETFSLCEGKALLIPPHVEHFFAESEDCAYHIATFTPAYAPDFDGAMTKFPPEEYLLPLEDDEIEFLEKRLFPLPIGANSIPQPTPDEYTVKSCFYLIAACRLWK